jgi:GntR family transcriptional regulator
MTDPERSPIAYQMLASSLREAIARGDFADGRQLPTEAELSAQHGVSRQTVRRALQDLVAEGLIYRVRGRGTFSTNATPGNRYLRSFGSIEDLMSLSVDTQLEVVTPFGRVIDTVAASRLRLDTDEVMEASFRRLHDGVPFCFTRITLPLALGRLVASAPELAVPGKRTATTIIEILEQRSPVVIAGADQSITSAAATPEICAQIECDPQDPVLRIDRNYFDREGQRVELAVSYFNPERYSYRLQLRRSPR